MDYSNWIKISSFLNNDNNRIPFIVTHKNLLIHYVDETTKNYDKIEEIPSITQVILKK